MDNIQKYYSAMGLKSDASKEELDAKYAQFKSQFNHQLSSDSAEVVRKAEQNLSKMEKIKEILSEHINSSLQAKRLQKDGLPEAFKEVTVHEETTVAPQTYPLAEEEPSSINTDGELPTNNVDVENKTDRSTQARDKIKRIVIKFKNKAQSLNLDKAKDRLKEVKSNFEKKELVVQFSCPSCKHHGSVPDKRVPEKGLNATCPKCKTKFIIKKNTLKSSKDKYGELSETAKNRFNHSKQKIINAINSRSKSIIDHSKELDVEAGTKRKKAKKIPILSNFLNLKKTTCIALCIGVAIILLLITPKSKNSPLSASQKQDYVKPEQAETYVFKGLAFNDPKTKAPSEDDGTKTGSIFFQSNVPVENVKCREYGLNYNEFSQPPGYVVCTDDYHTDIGDIRINGEIKYKYYKGRLMGVVIEKENINHSTIPFKSNYDSSEMVDDLEKAFAARFGGKLEKETFEVDKDYSDTFTYNGREYRRARTKSIFVPKYDINVSITRFWTMVRGVSAPRVRLVRFIVFDRTLHNRYVSDLKTHRANHEQRKSQRQQDRIKNSAKDL